MSTNIRLIELQEGRAWERPQPVIPPVEETERQIEQRLREVEPQRAQVFAAIDALRDEIIGYLQDLVRIPSVNPGEQATAEERFEKELAEKVAADMRELGMEVQSIEPAPRRASVLGRLRGSRGDKSLLIYAHLDTVPVGDPAEWAHPPFDATIVDGKMYGRGTKDCKLGLAAALMAARALRVAGIRLAGDLQVVAPADEETGGHWGIAQMVDAGMIKADWAIYGEGMPDFVTIGHRGLMNLAVTTRGAVAHTARKHLGDNAIVKMCQLLPRLEALEFQSWQPHPVIAGGTVASANLIRGGIKENVVPDRCTATFDIRWPPGTHYQAIVDEFRAAIEEAQREIPGLGQVDLELKTIARPSFINPDEPLVLYMRRAVSEVQGREIPARGMVATSDSRWILLDAGIPIVNFSMGNDSGHRPNEWAGIQDLIDNTKIYALAALTLIG